LTFTIQYNRPIRLLGLEERKLNNR